MASADAGLSLFRRIWSDDADVRLGLLRAGLVPLERLFGLVVWIRNILYNKRMVPITSSNIEVVSVGNLSVGGTGKTPFTAWLAGRFETAGRKPAIVHGGYAEDEPELHRRWQPDVPVVVGRDRAAAVREAAKLGADLAILDDGFQHRRLARDADIVLVAAEAGLKRIRLLPRGPWRERASALGRATLVVVTRKTATRERAAEVAREAEALTGAGKVAIVALEPGSWRHRGEAASLPEGRVLAVAALAEPEQFAETAMAAGARVSGTLWFRDHHDYTVEDAQRILGAAHGGPVVTTAKDAVKLETLLPESRLWILEQRVVVESGEDVLNGLVTELAR